MAAWGSKAAPSTSRQAAAEVPPELKRVAEEEFYRLCRQFPLPKSPTLFWRGYRVTAGMAYYRTWAIGLSSRVLTTTDAVVETLGHEYAHLLAVARKGKRAANHGPDWQQAMLDLGLQPKVRHRYEVQRNEARQVVTYRCQKCRVLLERPRRLRKDRVYVHAKCGGRLELLNVVKKPTFEPKNVDN